MDINHSKYTHITSATTTVLSTVACELDAVRINNAGAGTATIYDGTNVIAVLNTANGSGVTYGVFCAKGLSVTTSGNADITVVWA